MRLFSARHKSSSRRFARRRQEFGSLTRFCHATSTKSMKTNEGNVPRWYVSITMKEIKHPRCPKAFSPLSLIQATRRSLTATAVVPKRVTARRWVQRVFECAPRDRVRCARLWMASSCEMLLPPFAITTTGAPHTQSFYTGVQTTWGFPPTGRKIKIIRLLRLQTDGSRLYYGNMLATERLRNFPPPLQNKACVIWREEWNIMWSSDLGIVWRFLFGKQWAVQWLNPIYTGV